MESVDNIISTIKECVSNNQTIPSSLKSYIPTLHESQILLRDLEDTAYDVIRNALYLDKRGSNCWSFYSLALNLTDKQIEFANKSSILFEGRKKRSEWKSYTLTSLNQIYPLIKDFEYKAHSLFLLPYTSTDYKNIKLLHAKDLLIFFTLIKNNYENVKLTKYTCFRFDDIDISMNCLNYINKVDNHAYDYIIKTFNLVLIQHV